MKYLDHLEEWIIAFLIGAATLIIFVSIIHRYGAGLPIPGVQDWLIQLNLSWAQELTIYMFVWMAKFGAAYGVRSGIHVGVDVLVNRLPVEWRQKGVMVAIACGTIFTGIIGTLGATFVWENGMHYAVFTLLGIGVGDLPQGPTTPDLEWPTWVVYLAVPLGSYLMCFRFLQVGWRFIKTGELPRHNEGHVEGIDEVTEDTPGVLHDPIVHEVAATEGGTTK